MVGICLSVVSDNTLYYFLSTVPQVVAAAFGILGAIAVFRSQSSRERQREHLGIIKKLVKRLQSLVEHMQWPDDPDRQKAKEALASLLRAAQQENVADLHHALKAWDTEHKRATSEQSLGMQETMDIRDAMIAAKDVEPGPEKTAAMGRWFTLSLVATIVTLGLSLVGLALVDALTISDKRAIPALVAVGVSCAVTLAFLAKLVCVSRGPCGVTSEEHSLIPGHSGDS